MAILDSLTDEVAQTRAVAASAVVLINGLSDKLDEALASNDPAAVQALADDLRASREALAAAVTNNPVP